MPPLLSRPPPINTFMLALPLQWLPLRIKSKLLTMVYKALYGLALPPHLLLLRPSVSLTVL